MTEVNRLLLATAVAGGYVLGRTKKGRLALAAASYVAGRQYGIEPRKLVSQGRKWLKEVPQVAELGEQVRGELVTAGREAVSAAADRRLASFADALHERTLRLESAGEQGQGEDEEGPEEGPEEDEEDEEESAAEASQARGRAERGKKASRTGRASGKESAGRTGNDGQAGERRRGKAGETAPSGKRPAKKTTGKTPSRHKAPATGKKASPHAEHRR
ncbi:hypothetical protein GCM10015535_35530 [Streptomyces gelaticus]|uniref:Histone protein n=1 Tax=Streptomyces gelaticus TaxID=285446 RepID=A0ABQ2W337_9ACTN|nr:histone protein [Streptomyces gelaticus]GGV86765.1 hypothetical protein GCM10015535_35530 [Streptomyces gelaticus]